MYWSSETINIANASSVRVAISRFRLGRSTEGVASESVMRGPHHLNRAGLPPRHDLACHAKACGRSAFLLGQSDVHPRLPVAAFGQELPTTGDHLAVRAERACESGGLAAHPPGQALALLGQARLVTRQALTADVLSGIRAFVRVVSDDFGPFDLRVVHLGVDDVQEAEAAWKPLVGINGIDLDPACFRCLPGPSLRFPSTDQRR